jgi:hypothetical protein
MDDIASGKADTLRAYQIKAVLNAISPMIWRRFLVRSDTTLAQLHTLLQIAMGWSDDYLHQFRMHGKDYCIPRAHGLEYYRDAREVQLDDFQLRAGERFSYTYNMMAPWQIELRVEQVALVDSKRRYPVCVGGKRAGPEEDLEGPLQYRRWCRARNSSEAIDQLYRDMALLGERLQQFLKGGEWPRREDADFMEAYERIRDRIATDPDRFDRRALNREIRKGMEPPCTSELK